MAVIIQQKKSAGAPLRWETASFQQQQPQQQPQAESRKPMKPELEMILSNRESGAVAKDPGANPFKLMVDPALRMRLRQALTDLINDHENTLATYVSEGKLALESYKEYIELFARSLKETMDSVEGVSYLLKSAGFTNVSADTINLKPDWRWKDGFNHGA